MGALACSRVFTLHVLSILLVPMYMLQKLHILYGFGMLLQVLDLPHTTLNVLIKDGT